MDPLGLGYLLLNHFAFDQNCSPSQSIYSFIAFCGLANLFCSNPLAIRFLSIILIPFVVPYLSTYLKVFVLVIIVVKQSKRQFKHHINL